MGLETDGKLHCSFCNKNQDQIRKLVAGPKVFICDECVDVCVEIIEHDEASDGPPISPAMLCPVCRKTVALSDIINVGEQGRLCRGCLKSIQAMPSGPGNGQR